MKTPPITPLKKKRFQEVLQRWYRQHARDLPWRQTSDPYAILVSEIMLQQTQVDRVIEKYHEWLRLFPTVEQLANAPQKTVIAAWQGLGYNRRALYLQKAAQMIVQEMNGDFPSTAEELQKLPGVGPYTAGAVASFAFHQETPILDTNVKRVIGRIFLGYKQLAKTTDTNLWELSHALLPRKKAVYTFNQALMDFGAMVCTQKKPKCSVCPFQKICASYPAIQNAKPTELQLPKVQEALYFGQPRRIWRGKILRYLHTRPHTKATVTQIGKAIQEDFSADRLPWLHSVIQTLEKDGIVKQKNQSVSIE